MVFASSGGSLVCSMRLSFRTDSLRLPIALATKKKRGKFIARQYGKHPALSLIASVSYTETRTRYEEVLQKCLHAGHTHILYEIMRSTSIRMRVVTLAVNVYIISDCAIPITGYLLEWWRSA